MFSSRTTPLHTSILINQRVIRYLVLSKDSEGLHVVHHDEALLPEGVIVNGEVLRARILGDILSLIYTKINKVLKKKKIKGNNFFSLLLPHEYFFHTQLEVKGISESKKPSEMLKDYLALNIEEYPWAQRYSYVYALHEDTVYIEALPSELYQSYASLCKSAGFPAVKVVSDIAQLGRIVTDESSVVVTVDQEMSKIIEYIHGSYVKERSFDFSYNTLVAHIVKHLRVDTDFALKVVRQYGVSRAHPEQKVYQQIIRSTTGIVDYLRKKRDIKNTKVYLWYLDTPLIGFDDLLSKRLGVEVHVLDILSLPKHNFHEILDIHMKDSYRYHQLIAESMIRLS